MVNNKKEIFNNNALRVANYAKALSHPARVEILKILSERNECICGDLVSELPLSQSTISQHLKELKSSGLIVGTIDGPKTCYCLNPVIVKEMRGVLDDLLNLIGNSEIKCCCGGD